MPWLERANRLAIVARLLESTIHDANNALQVISGQAELLAMATVTTLTQQRADNIGERARAASSMLVALRTFAQDTPDRIERFRLSRVAELAVDLRRHSLNQLRIDVADRTAAADRFVTASQRAVLQIVLNLVLNAEQALAGRPAATLRLTTQLTTGQEGGDATELTVEDNGPGLPDDPLAWVPDEISGSNRLGVGLRVSVWMAGQQGGRLHWATPESGSGCRMRLTLPAVD